MSRRRLVLGLSIASLGAVLIALAVVVSGREDEEPLATINEGSGTYRGIGVGDDVAAVRRVFGSRPFAKVAKEPIAPTKTAFAEAGGPAIDPPCPIGEVRGVQRFAMLRYEQVSFLLCDGRVFAWMVVAGDARTSRGVGVGDDLERAEAACARVTCGDAPSGDFGSYPYCAGVIASQPGRRRLYTWFGEDPIASITISTSAFDG